MKITMTFLPKFLYAAIFVSVVFGRLPVEKVAAVNQISAAGGGLAEHVAMRQVHEQSQNAGRQEEKQQAGIDIGEIEIHSFTPLAKFNPSLANCKENVNPIMTVSTDSFVNDGAPGSNIFIASDANVILDKSSHQPDNFFNSKFDRSLSRYTDFDSIKGQSLASSWLGEERISAAGGGGGTSAFIAAQTDDTDQGGDKNNHRYQKERKFVNNHFFATPSSILATRANIVKENNSASKNWTGVTLMSNEGMKNPITPTKNMPLPKSVNNVANQLSWALFNPAKICPDNSLFIFTSDNFNVCEDDVSSHAGGTNLGLVNGKEKISAAGRGGAAQLAVNQEQGEGNRQQASANISAIDKFVNLSQSHDFLSRLIANIKKSITARTLTVKLNGESESGVEMKAAAATSVEKAAYTLKAWDDKISSFIDPENDSILAGWLSILAPRMYAGAFLKEGRITTI